MGLSGMRSKERDSATMNLDARAWGIQRRYRDSDGVWHTVPEATVSAVGEALGAHTARPTENPTAPLVLRAGERPVVPSARSITLEGGEERGVERGKIPQGLPLGYHRLLTEDGERDLIIAPRRCHLPHDLRTFGFAVQLYATRSASSWGIGDLEDLRALGAWARGLGAGLLLVSPLHAAVPVPPVEPSPYYPTSRIFRNPLHLAVETPAAEARIDLGELSAAGRALNADRTIDRDRIADVKIAALERIQHTIPATSEVAGYRAATPDLECFALFCAIAERHGNDWRTWPEELRRPDGVGLAQAARELSGRVALHAWIQWQLDRQMARAGAEIPLLLDLAVGVDPGGFDAWRYQDLLVDGITVGAPPDTFNTLGQDWGLPAFHPRRLRDAGYSPFIAMLRANLSHCGGLRIDHVMGLSRLWWVPADLGPAEGAYVHYPERDLLAIVALESVRAAAIVVGEDLGTVRADLRSRLRRSGVLSYRLLLFEDDPPERLPHQALAAVTTHDLPTIAGLWSGADLHHQEELGLMPDRIANTRLLQRLSGVGLSGDASIHEAVAHVHRRLGQAPSMVLTATLEDVAGVADRPNQPGTTSAQNPNWARALPLPIEELLDSGTARSTAAALRR